MVNKTASLFLLALSIVFQTLSSNASVGGLSDRANENPTLKGHGQVFVVPDLNELPSESEHTFDEGHHTPPNTHPIIFEAMTSHTDPIHAVERGQVKDTENKVRAKKRKSYSQLPESEKARRSKNNVRRIQVRKSMMTVEEKAAWNARSSQYVKKHQLKVHQSTEGEAGNIPTQHQDSFPKKTPLKRVPKKLTTEEFRKQESDRKREYRERKGEAWRRVAYRRGDAARRLKLAKSPELREKRRNQFRDNMRRSRARKEAERLGKPITPDIALKIVQRKKKP
ncbi:uncharacterized protein FA14DRAFT_178339 [Meira miltonrushii]|uniref:Uncharacterized protein n=1 Tax=Meira miltonrushii TaxID=1280837 RepID=A0A316VBN6_9BASI|nr:uncharacterized protein FA14DRAFT_178339 [Meira miltonrushii]PWN34946.1 hypothetical protein FA14DRAFT_178339 [Meira miltonrushii]